LGDFLTGIPAYRAIARAFPDHRITLAASRAYEPLLDLAGGIDDICATEPLQPLARELYGADVAVDLHGRGPASQHVLLAARPRRLISFRNAAVPRTRSGARWFADEHEVARWCRMLEHAGIAADPGDLDLRAAPGRFPPRTRAMTIVHASAASESRRWPVERWAAVARAEARAGRIVALTGSAGERERVQTIADRAGIPRAQVLAGRTNLRQLAALVASAGRLVCGDTGVGHLATAVRTPSVLLFGPTPPAQWGPPSRAYHRVLWTGRRGDPHGACIDRGLLDISVDAVLAELAALDKALPVAV
jgi:ADP-heptose:LPS heptosyltransferase